MRPMNNNVLIVPIPKEEEVVHGVVIPSAIKLEYEIGTVVAIHSGKLLPDGTVQPCNLAVKNLVAYYNAAGVEITIGDKPCRIMPESEVLAVLMEDFQDKGEVEGAGGVISIVKDE